MCELVGCGAPRKALQGVLWSFGEAFGFVRGATRAFRAFAKRLQAGLSRLRKGLQGLMVEPPHDFRFQGPTTTPVQHST